MMELLIGEANYSTWSMRPWLFLRGFDVPFTTRHISLVPQSTLSQRLLEFSPSAKVPVLIDRDVTIWDTLAICQYICETHLSDVNGGLPSNRKHRATALSIIAEMHSGFSALRRFMPMNIRATRLISTSAALSADIQRIDDIWSDYNQSSGWLFDEFSMADCFYAPIAMRFKTYGVALSPKATAYYNHICKADVVQQWCAMAQSETSIVPMDEVGFPQSP